MSEAASGSAGAPAGAAPDSGAAGASSNELREGIFAHWPNRVTAIRFVGALILFALLAWMGDRPPTELSTPIAISFWLFVLVAATDFVDGYLARRDGHVTTFGRIADPFVDKVLVVGTFVMLAVLPWSAPILPAWIVVVVLAREFLVTGIRGFAESQGLEFSADRFGKLKMIVQCIAIGAILGQYALPWPTALFEAVRWLAHVSVWATLLTTVGSGATYVLKLKRMVA